MSYRKITVQGHVHKYVVGKKFLRIRGPLLKKALHIPLSVEDTDLRCEATCECCGERMSDIYPDRPVSYNIMVTPSYVAMQIKNNACVV